MKKNTFFGGDEGISLTEKLGLVKEAIRPEPNTARGIRIGLNMAAFILTGGTFHLFYYAIMAINWFVEKCTNVRAFDNMEWDPFANFEFLNPSPSPAYGVL